MIVDKNQSKPKNIFSFNRQKLLNKLENNSLAILFSEAPKYRNATHEYKYRQNSNFIYLTGILEPVHSLWLLKDSAGNTDAFILIPEYDEKTKIYQGSGISTKEIESISGIQQIYTFNEAFYKKLNTYKTIYCEKEKNNLFLHQNYPEKLQDISPIISNLRLIKEPEEIDFIKTAIQITGKAFHELLRNFRYFKTEADIEAFITSYFIRKGQYPHAYLPIVASGANALTLHYTHNSARLHKNELTLLDFGCEYNGYASDLSRTIPNKGKFSKRQKEVYTKVLSIVKEVQSNIKPGITIKELNKFTQKLMQNALVELNLIPKSKTDDNSLLLKKYFPHGVSHFIGLDVHDCGNTETILQEGMVLSCEPGIYIPEESIGIRLENDILVAPHPINLMQNIAIEVDEIENIMN